MKNLHWKLSSNHESVEEVWIYYGVAESTKIEVCALLKDGKRIDIKGTVSQQQELLKMMDDFISTLDVKQTPVTFVSLEGDSLEEAYKEMNKEALKVPVEPGA